MVQRQIKGLGGMGHDDIAQHAMVDHDRLAVHEEGRMLDRHLLHLVGGDGRGQEGQSPLPEVARPGQDGTMLILHLEERIWRFEDDQWRHTERGGSWTRVDSSLQNRGLMAHILVDHGQQITLGQLVDRHAKRRQQQQHDEKKP